MPLVLTRDHPARDGLALADAAEPDPLRVGIINIMPKLEGYEPLLLRRLAAAKTPVEPVFLRLQTHGYTSSDQTHLDRFYRRFDEVGHLDGLILTGAPVEEVAFEDVHYWRELGAILTVAKREIRSTLGICWGGLALGAVFAEVPKRVFPRKLFGVFDHEIVHKHDPLLARTGSRPLSCAHSRHSGCDDEALDRAAESGRVRVLARSPETGVTVFASPDHRFVAHLGHPEYEADRLVFEWERDQRAGRTDVSRPHALDLTNPTTTWRADSEEFFARWLDLLRTPV